MFIWQGTPGDVTDVSAKSCRPCIRFWHSHSFSRAFVCRCKKKIPLEIWQHIVLRATEWQNLTSGRRFVVETPVTSHGIPCHLSRYSPQGHAEKKLGEGYRSVHQVPYIHKGGDKGFWRFPIRKVNSWKQAFR